MLREKEGKFLHEETLLSRFYSIFTLGETKARWQAFLPFFSGARERPIVFPAADRRMSLLRSFHTLCARDWRTTERNSSVKCHAKNRTLH